MKIEIIEEKQNPLLHRKELVVLIKNVESTPKRADVQGEVVAMAGGSVVLGSFETSFGKKEVKCGVKVYESDEFKDKYEPKKKEKGEKKAAAETPATPKEEKK